MITPTYALFGDKIYRQGVHIANHTGDGLYSILKDEDKKYASAIKSFLDTQDADAAQVTEPETSETSETPEPPKPKAKKTKAGEEPPMLPRFGDMTPAVYDWRKENWDAEKFEALYHARHNHLAKIRSIIDSEKKDPDYLQYLALKKRFGA